MTQERSSRDDPVASLLALLREPGAARRLDLTRWDGVARVARTARLLALLRLRLEAGAELEFVPEPVRVHLDSAWTLARYRRQMVHWELECIARALASFDGPIVLLKGAAYIVQGFDFAAGRMPSDVDVMVPRRHLDAAERTLLNAGWQMESLDPYDEHYYRAWSHELPPLRYPEHPLELDLHHTILPVTGRAKPDAGALFAAAISVAGTRFHVLSPADQVLHAASQIFQDSDCSEKLRDLTDVDSLLREFGSREGFWKELVERARVHGLGRSLLYALRYANRYLGTGVPEEMVAAISAPPAPVLGLMDALVHRALLPAQPDRPPRTSVRVARRLLFLRSHWLRMPPPLLVRHALTKGWRGLQANRVATT